MLQVSVQSLSFSVNPFATIEKHTLFTGLSLIYSCAKHCCLGLLRCVCKYRHTDLHQQILVMLHHVRMTERVRLSVVLSTLAPACLGILGQTVRRLTILALCLSLVKMRPPVRRSALQSTLVSVLLGILEEHVLK